VIFFGGQVVTMEADQPTAQAVAILGDKIIAVGSDSEILDLQSPQTTLVNLEGLTLLPGFIDAHSHLFNAADQWGLDWEGAQQLALAYGITSVANTYADPAFLSEMQAFSESGRLRIRTSLYLNYNTNCGDVVGALYWDHLPSHAPAERLRIGGVKIFADGGSCGAPAMSFDHPAFGYGDLWFTQDELNQVLSDVQASGHQAAVHALGDRAVEQTLNALEFVLDGRANTFRHRIEHNALVRDDLLPRYGEVGVVPLLFGSYPVCAPDAVPPPEEQDGWEWRWSELIDQNPDLHFAWHSDMHTFLFAQISPLQHLFSLVTPFEVASDGATICDTPAWIGAKTLAVEQALPMMTIEGAYALFQDEAVGSIRPGKLADLLIISGNPLNKDSVEIIDLRILMTMIGGRVEHCEDGYEDLCSFQP
jgi:predicted amidohydrolase YtcJ